MPADGEGNETPQFLLKTSPVRGVRKKRAAQPCFHPCTPAQRETNLTCPGFCRLLTKAKTQQSSPREISQLKTSVQVRSFPKAPFFLGGGEEGKIDSSVISRCAGADGCPRAKTESLELPQKRDNSHAGEPQLGCGWLLHPCCAPYPGVPHSCSPPASVRGILASLGGGKAELRPPPADLRTLGVSFSAVPTTDLFGFFPLPSSGAVQEKQNHFPETSSVLLLPFSQNQKDSG